MNSLKLTLSQYLLATAAVIIAVLGAILKFKEHELAETHAALLSQKFLNEQQLQDQAISQSDQKVADAKKQMEDSLAKLRAIQSRQSGK